MANYKETENYNIKYPKTGDLTTINEWGDIVNEGLETIDSISNSINTTISQSDSNYTDLENDLIDIQDDVDSTWTASGVPLISDVEDVESVAPLSTSTKNTLDALNSSVQTKYYSTLPTLISATTDTGGLTDTEAAYLHVGSGMDYAFLFDTENGALQSITYGLAPVGPLLTKVEVWVSRLYGTIDAGLEDEIDANGGTNIADFTQNGFDAGLPGYKMTVDLSSSGILWDDRYNYRIGGANMYQLLQVILYQDGVISESQTSISGVASGLKYREGHVGFNLDPTNRVPSSSPVINPVSYPKSID